MPIVGKNNRITIEYKLPNRIKNLINNNFLQDMNDVIDKSYTYKPVAQDYEQIEGTYRWQEAFEYACDNHTYKHMGIGLKRYCKSLKWYDYDLFCDEITQLMIKRLKIERDEHYWDDNVNIFKYKMKLVRKCNDYRVYKKMYSYEDGFKSYKGDDIFKY